MSCAATWLTSWSTPRSSTGKCFPSPAFVSFHVKMELPSKLTLWIILVTCSLSDEEDCDAFDSQSGSTICLNNGTVLCLREVNRFLALLCILREDSFTRQGKHVKQRTLDFSKLFGFLVLLLSLCLLPSFSTFPSIWHVKMMGDNGDYLWSSLPHEENVLRPWPYLPRFGLETASKFGLLS